MESFRKAVGALKDSTKVGLANLNSDFKELDVAIVKATNHVECPPKERHVGKILAAISANRPRADVAYCIHALWRRLSKTRNWIVAIKTLIVIHRTLREGDYTFREELVRYANRGKMFQLYNFKDDTTSLAWDCSAWVRTYSLFLEERVECLRTIQYDLDVDKAPKSGPQASKMHSKARFFLNDDRLLEQLPSLQQLLYRLICCQPEGLACHNYLVQYALALVLKESFKIYCSINDGIINLVDLFFDMPKHDAIRALDVYKRAGKQAAHLADFYGFCRTLDLARTFHFPTLKQPPPTFLATMEEYIKEAPQLSDLNDNRLEYRKSDNEAEEGDESPEEETEKQLEEKEEVAAAVEEEEEPPETEEVQPPPPKEDPIDLLGLSEVNEDALRIEESNALALAIFEPGDNPPSSSNALTEIGSTSGWELAIVEAPSNTNKPQPAQPQMAGGFDNLLLDSLYEDSAARRAMELHSAGYSTSYGYNPHMQTPFDQQQQQFDPFSLSNNFAPPTNVQMALMAQQEQMAMMQQQQQQMMMMTPMEQQQQGMNMVAYNPYYVAANTQQIGGVGGGGGGGGYFNPFDDPFSYPQPGPPPPQGKNNTPLL